MIFNRRHTENIHLPLLSFLLDSGKFVFQITSIFYDFITFLIMSSTGIFDDSHHLQWTHLGSLCCSKSGICSRRRESMCERDIIAEQQTYCVMSYLPENNAVDLVKWLILSSASQMTEQSQENPDTSLCEASLNISQNPLCSGKIFIVFVVIDLPFQNPMTFLFRISCC
jgi:hypothetical protein